MRLDLTLHCTLGLTNRGAYSEEGHKENRINITCLLRFGSGSCDLPTSGMGNHTAFLLQFYVVLRLQNTNAR